MEYTDHFDYDSDHRSHSDSDDDDWGEPLDTRDQILSIVKGHPGIHFRGIVESSSREVGVVDYHLTRLEKEGQVLAVRHRNNKLFFDSSTWGDRVNEVQALVANLRKPIPRSLLLLLSEHKGLQKVSIKQLAILLKRSPSSLQWQLKRLIEDGLIEPVRRRREVTISLLVDPPERIAQLCKQIYPSRWERFLAEVDRTFHDIFTID